MIATPLAGEAWFAKKGKDLVHSFVYCAAVVFVVPSADSNGDVVALYVGGPVGDAEEKRFTVGGDFVLHSQSVTMTTSKRKATFVDARPSTEVQTSLPPTTCNRHGDHERLRFRPPRRAAAGAVLPAEVLLDSFVISS